MDPREALSDLIDRFRGPLTGLLASWGAGWGEAAELAQDALAEAWVGRSRLRGRLDDDEVVGPWLNGIAWNLFRASQRRTARGPERLSPDHDPAAPAAEEDDRAEALRAELARLPQNERTALAMFYLEETSVHEVAALLGVTVKTVEGRLYRGRHMLRERLSAAAAGGTR